jgi:hypothetical protein
VDNNPIYASAVAILAVFLLFFIIIGNLWTIQGEYYSMSNPYDGYLADDGIFHGDYEFSQAEFYATPLDVPPISEGKIDGKIIDTYGTIQINTQTWDYNYATSPYNIIGYEEIRTPVDKYVDSENQTNPVYILNQDVYDTSDILVYVDNQLIPTSAYTLSDVTTKLSEHLYFENTTIRVQSTEYFLVQNEQSNETTFKIGNEKVDCEYKNETEFRNCKRGIDSTAPSAHTENTIVTQSGQRRLSLDIVVYRDEIVEVRHPIEYYYESVKTAYIPDTIDTVDLGDYNTTYGEYNIYTGDESRMYKLTNDVHLLINISQLCFTMAMFLLLCIYFKVKIQFFDHPEFFKTGALIFCVLSILLATATGIYFFIEWPSAYEEDTKFFEDNGFENSTWGEGRFDYSVQYSSYSFERCTQERTITNSNYYYLNNGEPNTSNNCDDEVVNFNQQRYIDYEWKLTWNWFLITLLIPILGIICLVLIFSLDVDGYYSSTSTIDTIDEFMTIPDHDDGYHVNFAEALGYGFSVLANWISYIVAIAAINTVFFVIITWVLLRGTFSSFVIAGILGFVGFLLNAALLMAVLYKYQSDINMKISESLVNEGLKDFRPPTERRTSRQQPIPELAIASIVEEAEKKKPKTPKKKKGKKGTKTNPMTPETQEDFDSVPSGKYYINPSDSEVYKKD